MRLYELWAKLSESTICYNVLEAENLKDITEKASEEIPRVRENFHISHPVEELLEIEIYDVVKVKVATIDLAPKIVVEGKGVTSCGKKHPGSGTVWIGDSKICYGCWCEQFEYCPLCNKKWGDPLECRKGELGEEK